MIGRAQELGVTESAQEGRRRRSLAGLLDQLLGKTDALLTAPLEAEPARVAPPSPRAGLRFFVGLDRRLIVPVAVLVVFFLFCFIRQTDYDWWWHLQIGADIWRAKAIPTADTYSYTRAGQPFVAHEWLFELLTYLGYRALGYGGLAAIMGLIVLATYALHYLLLRAVGAGRVLAGFVVWWTMLLSFMAITMRPHLFSALFLAIELWCLYLYRAGHRRAIWFLPPLALLWVNIHGAWIMGLGTLGLFIVGEWLNARARQEPAQLRPALGVLAASLALVALNPQGPTLYLYPLSFIGAGSATMKYIQEWQSPNFHELMGLSFALSVILLAVLGLRRPRFDYTLALWALAFTYLGFSAMRHIPLYALVVMPIIVQQLPPSWRGAEWPYRENRFTAALNWVLILIVAGVSSSIILGNPLAQVHAEPNLKGYPSVSLAYLRDHPGGNLLNQDGWGGYLIANLPERRVFIDTRVDFYGRDFLEEYITLARARPGWRDALQRYDISLVLMPPDTPIVTALRDDPGWRVVVEGEEEVLLERVN